MKENTNKALVVNSLINYAKLGINIVLALFTTRYALQALGVVDYGLYSLLGSVISFIGLYNTIMVSTCNRFLAVAIGKGDINEINKQFNVNLVIFLFAALLMLIIAFPIGEWYINNKVHYDGPIENAKMVFNLTIISSIIATIATPFYGLLMAKEKFIVFSAVDVFFHIIRFLIALLIVHFFNEKLLIYTITISLSTAIPTFIYWIYCRKHFGRYIKWNFVKDKGCYKKVFSFSGWVAYGAVACVAKNQGAAIIVNVFFNTIMNTALGIANSLNSYVSMFANSLTQPMQPQITKSYAAGNKERTNQLLVMSTKYSFLLMLLISAPFFVGAEWVLSLWLGDVPPYAVSFTILLIIDNLVLSFNSGLSTVLFASGRIVRYQLLVNTLRLLSIIVAYFILKSGTAPEYLFYTYIVFSVIVIFVSQICLHLDMHYDNSILIRKSYIPSCLVLVFLLPMLFIVKPLHPATRIIITLVYLIIIEFLIGLNNEEKKSIIGKIRTLKFSNSDVQLR